MKFTYCKRPNSAVAKQQGSAILLALFILVVLALLAISLLRLLSDSNRSVANEVYGTRALLAAHSGVELGLVTLFPLTNGQGEACWNGDLTYSGGLANQPGLPNCSVAVQCTSTLGPDGQTYYRITSEGVCSTSSGANEEAIFVARTLEVEARGLAL